MVNFNVRLIDTNKQITGYVLQALLPEVDKYLNKAFKTVRNLLPGVIQSIITNTPEYNSLIGGQLQWELGIPDPSSALSNLLNIWSSNIETEYNRRISNSKIIASFSVSAIRSDFSDVLSSEHSLVIDNLRGYQLPWLEWLLLEGNKIIIPKQQVEFGANRRSRTGYAIMRPANKSWRVPSEFSGTISDNWITRAIENNESQISELLNKVFT